MPETDKGEVKRDDRRSRRTRRALGEALVALMLEKRYDEITVQEIIDEANVGRSTFYSHYLDKEDLLQSEVSELVSRLGVHMEQDAAGAGAGAGAGSGSRIVPSLELLRHLQESHDLYHALVRGRAIETVLKTMQDQFSQHTEARLARRLPPGASPIVPLPLVAQYIAGTLLTLFHWWIEREMPESPEQLDEYFLQLIRPSVFAATGVEL